MTNRDLYREAGVDIDAGNEAARRYAKVASVTERAETLGRIGGFAGGFRLNLEKYPQPILMSGTDGVGTKLKVAFALGQHNTIGIDCVAMCVNDILTSGAEPLFFLDYLATGKLDVDVAEAVVAGVAEGCKQAGCALVGGETAEMPSMYSDGEYDIAGFVTGVVNEPDVVDGRHAEPGDIVLGLASHGLHSNGYSLVRKLLDDHGVTLTDTLPGLLGTVGQELLKPTRIYVQPVLDVLRSGFQVKAMSHITGGGLLENIPRSLPENHGVQLYPENWSVPAVFSWLMKASGMTFNDAARVWNMGIGYVLVVSPKDADAVSKHLHQLGETVYNIGHVVRGSGVEL